jgi:hypothetical protein
MRTIFRVVTLAALAACSATVTVPNTSPVTSNDALVTTDGQLKLTVTDTVAQPGMLFITGTIVGGQGMVTVASTRYGSLCATTITAHADVATGKIALTVKYGERLALCTAGIRSITYRAQIGGLAAGAYDVSVIHTNADNSTSTVLAQRVTVS